MKYWVWYRYNLENSTDKFEGQTEISRGAPMSGLSDVMEAASAIAQMVAREQNFTKDTKVFMTILSWVKFEEPIIIPSLRLRQ